MAWRISTLLCNKRGGILCASNECANGPEAKDIDDDQWNIIAYDIHYEGEPFICDHCGVEIESAYGVPE